MEIRETTKIRWEFPNRRSSNSGAIVIRILNITINETLYNGIRTYDATAVHTHPSNSTVTSHHHLNSRHYTHARRVSDSPDFLLLNLHSKSHTLTVTHSHRDTHTHAMLQSLTLSHSSNGDKDGGLLRDDLMTKRTFRLICRTLLTHDAMRTRIHNHASRFVLAYRALH